MLLCVLTVGAVSASEDVDIVEDETYEISENIADDSVLSYDEESCEISDNLGTDSISDSGNELDLESEVNENNVKNTSVVDSKNLGMYYKDGSKLTASLLDNHSKPIANKTLNIFICGKNYSIKSDAKGKVALPINLNPGKYYAKISFAGDEEYSSSSLTLWVNVKKIPVSVKTSNLNVFKNSDIFFTVKLFNMLTNLPIANVKVLFKVYSGKNYKKYYSTTDSKGIAKLNKNLAEGSYVVYTSVDDKAFAIDRSNAQEKTTLKIKPTAEWGCCSVILHVNGKETVVSFRRDSTSAAGILIAKERWWGRDVIKQYKVAEGYFFHTVTTADGWAIGTGGSEEANVNRYIERIAGQMVSQGYLQMPKLLQIKKALPNIGHFVIKTPYGRYAVVWHNTYKLGVLKPGEYLCVPNKASYYRHGNYKHFDPNPVNAAIKIAATDKYGVYRRNIMAYHYKQTTAGDFSISSSISAYATNDDGKSVGRSTAYLKDNIKFINKFYDKNKLPLSPGKISLGKHNFGKIDRLVKTPTVVYSTKVINVHNQNKFFKVTLKLKSNKKPVSGVKIRVNVYTGNKFVKYVLKTDKNGIALLNTKNLKIGTHNVVISPENAKYIIAGKSTIVIK